MAERNYEQELANICDALAESVLDMSDEEIEEEIRAEGLDPREEAGKVRAVLRGAVDKHRLLSEAQTPQKPDFTRPSHPRKPHGMS